MLSFSGRVYPESIRGTLQRYNFTELFIAADSKCLVVTQNEAKKKKKGFVHALRHSFTTHLFEGVIDISSVRELLGYTSIHTTMIYTHVSNLDNYRDKNPIAT